MSMLLRIIILVVAFVLSSITISKVPGTDLGSQGLKGVPIPYDYATYPTFPSSQNNLLYAVDFFFWIIILNLAINFIIWRNSNKASGNRWLVSKELIYMLTISSVVFFIALTFHFAFGTIV